MLLDVPEARARLFTDASESGWGAHLDDLQTSGSWSTREATLHINHLEMLAVLYALRAFRVQLTGLTVQLMSDNCSVVSYIRKQGGGERCLCCCTVLLERYLLLARDAQITLVAKHIPGDQNALADLLSRMNEIVHTEWTLHQSVFKAQCITCDTPNLDLFATCLNNRLPVFVSPMADPLAVDVDAMSMSWKGMYAYAFPPFVMLGRVLEKVLLKGSSLRDDSSRPEMAQSVLVCQNVGTTSRLSFCPATEGRSAVPASQPPDTLVTPSGVPTRLEAVKRSLTERGFSPAAADQISRGRRQSSRAVYDSKWRIFSGWCAGQSVDPFQVTIPQLADFFVFLFQVKHLNPRTIKGYRSAISSMISSCGSRTELSYSQELSSLKQSFQLERPLQRKVAPPQWHLSLVLQALTKPPFEPIAKCELKFLTLKTVFLVALVSGRRQSELHALCFDSHHFRQNQDQSMVTLYPDLEFVAKTQALDAVAEPINLRAFTLVGSDDIDRKLCPVRSLLQYRKATTTPVCRKGRKKLIISYKPAKSDEIKRATISSWIVKLIRLAYESEGSDPRTLELHKVSAHEVRALSASTSVFRGMTLDTVLQSCTWRSRNTFSDVYLRDMCSFLDDIFVMSSSVAGT